MPEARGASGAIDAPSGPVLLQARAVLFDFNGVLLDDETFHWRAFRRVLAPRGIALSRKQYDERYLAFDDATALRAMLEDAGLGGRGFDRLLRQKRILFRRLCGSRVRIDPAVADLIRALARRVPLAIVSGAIRAEIDPPLARAGIRGAFRTIVSSEDVSRCKPDPAGYLLGLDRLGLAGGEGSLAVEDSPGGIQAARAAGLSVLGVATSYEAAVLRRAGAVRVTSSLARLAPEDILDITGPGRRQGGRRADLRRARRPGRP